jgi:hypothetical protein
MVKLAETDVDTEDGREDEVEEKVEHCWYVALIRHVVK